MWLPRLLRHTPWIVALPAKLGPLTAVGRTIKIDTPAEVAQVVEHGTENAGVDSSSLSLGTLLFPLLIFPLHWLPARGGGLIV